MNFRRILLLTFLLSVQIFIQSCGLTTPGESVGRIMGLVKDTNGFVLPDTRVGIVGMNLETSTDREGKFLLSTIPTGELTVVATRGEVSVTTRVKVEKDSTTDDVLILFTEADQLAPTISNISATNIVETSATILWNTSEMATGKVEFGITSGYGSATQEITDLTSSHSVILSSLIANTQYHYRVKSKDGAGNEVTSADFIFATTSGTPPNTPASLVIANPATPGTLTISWNAGSEADLAGYELHRSLEPDRDFTQINSGGLGTTFSDTALTIGEKYYYKVRAYDTGGNKGNFSETVAKVITGPLTGNITWKPSKSPYILTGDILIDIGFVLTVLPGTEIKAETSSTYDNALGIANTVGIIVRGALNARGTADSMIRFTSNATLPKESDWLGIRFIGTTDALNVFEHCSINFAREALFADASTLSFVSNQIGYSTTGINSQLASGTHIIRNQFSRCGICIVSQSAVITNNLITDSSFGMITLGLDKIENNTIDANNGIRVDAGNPVIRNNIIAFGPFTYIASGAIAIGPGSGGIQSGTVEFNNIFNYDVPLGPGYDLPQGSGTLFVNPLYQATGSEPFKLQAIINGYASDSPLLTAGVSGGQMGFYGP